MKKLLLFTVMACLIITNKPVIAKAPLENKVLSVKETISYFAEIHDANETELLGVAKCESSYNPKATGDGGKAKNVFQYHRPTFEAFSKLLGEKLDYYSYYDQSKLTAFIWKNYPQYKNHWTCYTKLYN